MFGDEVFVGVECGGPVRGRKGDAFGGGEDGLDEVVGGRGLADDGQGPAGDRASHQVGVVAGGVDDDGDPVSVDVRDVLVGGRAVGEAQVEDGDLPALPPRFADGWCPANGCVGTTIFECSLHAEADDAVVVNNDDLRAGFCHRASPALPGLVDRATT